MAANQLGEAIFHRHRELASRLRALTEEDLVAASLLPGWNRLTIACHLRFGAETNHAMTLATLAGQHAAFYPQGRAQQRLATLRPRHGEAPTEVIDSLISASEQLDSLWRTLDADQWDLVVREPIDNPDLGPTTLGILALLRLTEVEVHGLDLDVGCDPWSDVFIDAALPMRIRWLATRRSNHALYDDGVEGDWVLRATNGTAFLVSTSHDGVAISEGDDVEGGTEIIGSKRDLLAFLLGRLGLSELSTLGDRQLAESFSAAFPAP